MGKLKKIKKQVARAERAAERAEAAYRRTPDLVEPGGETDQQMAADPVGVDRRPIYTGPAGANATPAAAHVP
jgi:hypothetical protein